jgi:hypothetical protein
VPWFDPLGFVPAFRRREVVGVTVNEVVLQVALPPLSRQSPISRFPLEALFNSNPFVSHAVSVGAPEIVQTQVSIESRLALMALRLEITGIKARLSWPVHVRVAGKL